MNFLNKMIKLKLAVHRPHIYQESYDMKCTSATKTSNLSVTSKC